MTPDFYIERIYKGISVINFDYTFLDELSK